jgi:hypothetical protein
VLSKILKINSRNMLTVHRWTVECALPNGVSQENLDGSYGRKEARLFIFLRWLTS